MFARLHFSQMVVSLVYKLIPDETAAAIVRLFPQKAGRREWMRLAVLALPTLLVAMDATVTYLALPALSSTMKPSSARLLWITGCLYLPGRRTVDHHGDAG